MLVLSVSVEIRVGPVVLWRRRESRQLPRAISEAFLPVVQARGGLIVLMAEHGVTITIGQVTV